MKKILLTLALAAFAMTANAQWVLGGKLDINHNSNYDDDYSRGSANTNIGILPKVGYWLNDNMQIGIQLGWDYNYTRDYGRTASTSFATAQYASDTYESTPQSAVVIAPYFRYNFASWKNFTVFCEAQLNVKLGLESKTHRFVNGSEVTGYPTDNNDNYTTFGLNVVPGLNYAFNDHISMDIYVNILGLYAEMTTNEGSSSHKWGLMADMSAQSLNAHLNNFSIGFNYAL